MASKSETRGIGEIGEANPPQTQSAGDVVRELWTTWNSETSHELRRLCVANLAFFATIAGANKLGPSNIIVPALLATAGAFAYLPWASHHGYEFVAVAMAVQGLGSCVLGSAPTAAAANAVPEEERAGALALLRVCGDLGLLTGSAGFGALAAAAGSDAAFGAASVLLVGTAARFRYLAPSK